MISSGIDPQLAASQAKSQDMIRFKTEMDGLKQRLSGDTVDKEKQLRKACQNFEAVFIGKLWQQMKSTVPKEGYLHSKQEDSYMAMFDKEFSEKMAQAGGIGLADMIYSQLSEKLKETSKSTLGGNVEIRPLAAQPIALNQGGGGIALQGAPEGMTLEDWGGSTPVGGPDGENGVSGMTSEDIAAGLLGHTGSTQPMSDVDVKAKLDELARRLESERIKEGLLGAGTSTKSGYNQEKKSGSADDVGRKLAEIG